MVVIGLLLFQDKALPYIVIHIYIYIYHTCVSKVVEERRTVRRGEDPVRNQTGYMYVVRVGVMQPDWVCRYLGATYKLLLLCTLHSQQLLT